MKGATKMAKQLKLDKYSSGIRAAVLTKEIKYNLKKFALNASTNMENVTMSDVLRHLILKFNDRVETEVETEDVSKLIVEFCGKDLYTTKDTTSTTFRIENDEYKKFCHYSLCIGNDPSELLRKLVLQALGCPISTYSPSIIHDIPQEG